MEENDKLYETLIGLLKLFKNRPYHLAKYLIDNNSLSDSFTKKLIASKFKTSKEPIFKDITHLNDYFNSLLNDDVKSEKTIEEISIDLSQKLDKLIKDEKYEEAIYVRDYMNKNNIPRV